MSRGSHRKHLPGCSPNARGWRSVVTFNARIVRLGDFPTQVEAYAYHVAARELLGMLPLAFPRPQVEVDHGLIRERLGAVLRQRGRQAMRDLSRLPGAHAHPRGWRAGVTFWVAGGKRSVAVGPFSSELAAHLGAAHVRRRFGLPAQELCFVAQTAKVWPTVLGFGDWVKALELEHRCGKLLASARRGSLRGLQ